MSDSLDPVTVDSRETTPLDVDNPPRRTAPEGQVRITFKFIEGLESRDDVHISMLPTTRIRKAHNVLAERTGMCESSLKLYHELERVPYDATPASLGLGKETVMLVRPEMKGGKPVIYLFPPSALPSVQVDLTLVPEWTFSALYPVAEIRRGKGGKSTSSWTVSASPDGTLVDKASSLSLSYLFWEAHAPLLPPSPPLLPQDSVARSLSAFNPGRPSINRSNSALLPFNAFLSHLDAALSSLTLHNSARNDFITYWLPHFIRIRDKGEQIAFRFLPQVEYEQAAELQVEPKPDVVTRVFLLFKGVKEVEQEGWLEAQEMDWVKEVGVKAEAREEKLFRCLEWGGMEVSSA